MIGDPISIYLLSSERSGSNLLRHRLCQYANNMCSVPPVAILRTLGYWEPLMGPFSKDDKWYRTIQYSLRCCYERAVPWEIELTPEYIFKVYTDYYGDDRTIVRLTDVLYREYAAEKGFSGYFCKEIHLFDFVENIAHQLPHVSFIHLYRDPRDYVLSQQNRPFGNQSALDLAKLWLKECNRCLRATNSPLLWNKFISLSYEQLLQQEIPMLKKIINNFGLDVQEAVDKSKQDVPVYNFHELKNVHRPTIKNNFKKYQNMMSKQEIRIVEAICWNTMRFLGYSTEYQQRPSIAWSDRYLYQFIKHIKTILRNQINRFKLRNEPINRRATQALVAELTKTYR